MTVYNTYITFQNSFERSKITSGMMRNRYLHLNQKKDLAVAIQHGVTK